MVIEPIKSCSPSLVVRKVQTKTNEKLPPTRMVKMSTRRAKITETKKTNISKDAE